MKKEEELFSEDKLAYLKAVRDDLRGAVELIENNVDLLKELNGYYSVIRYLIERRIITKKSPARLMLHATREGGWDDLIENVEREFKDENSLEED